MSSSRVSSRSLLRVIVLAMASAAFFSGSALASVPDPAHSTIPAAVSIGSGGCCFDVVVRDFASVPIAGVEVTIDFGVCEVALCAGGGTVSAFTDVNGVAHFCICGSNATPSCMAEIIMGTVDAGRFPVQSCESWFSNGVSISGAGADQTFPTIVGDGTGGAIIAWQDHRSGTDYDIYAQHVLASGVVDPAWPTNGRALCTASLDQRSPVIASDTLGGAIVAWDDSRSGNHDIYAQHVRSNGTVDGSWPADGRALCVAAGNQQFPAIVEDGRGGAIVTWDDLRGGNHDVYAQNVLNSGVVAWALDGIAVGAATGDQEHPSITTDYAYGALIAWEDLRSGTSYDVYAQHLNSLGNVVSGWPANGRALCTASGNQRSTAIASDYLQGAIVTWQDRRNGSNNDIYAQHVTASGQVDLSWPTDGRALCVAAGDQLNPRIEVDHSSGAIATWQDKRGADIDVYAQHVLSTGALDGRWPTNGLVLSGAAGDQAFPVIATDENGGAFVAWQDSRVGAASDIYADHVLITGMVDAGWPVDGGAICVAANTQAFPAIARDRKGGAIIAWHDLRNGTDDDIYAQYVSPTVFFNGVSNSPVGGAQLIRAGDTLRVTGIGGSGGDGLKIALPDGVSEFKTTFQLADDSSLPTGAYLEWSGMGSGVDDSLGFMRMTHLATPAQYSITGAIKGASEKIVAAYKGGVEIYRDRRPNSGVSPDAITPHGTQANDDLGGRAMSPDASPPLSPLFLRCQWAGPTALTITSRPGGAADTVVTGDELRILETDPPPGNYASLSEFFMRGKDLGELRIITETSQNVGVRPVPTRVEVLSLAAPVPNPSPNGSALFGFRLARADRVSFQISDVGGRRVASRAGEFFSAGSHALRWDPRVRAPGLYFVRLVTGSGETVSRRWIVLR
jgi:hypothetical protein